jgi:hypothetical protein
MNFVYPAFLFALLSLIVPVLVHLFNFRKFQKVLFSNVQFLKEIQEQQASKRNLKERLILISRLLALFFLVLAFARPYIPGAHAANAGKQNSVSIFVDNSYSMETLNREGSLLDEARRRAKEIAAAYQVNDRFQLLTQDFEGKHQRMLSRDEFNAAVDEIKISPQSRTLQQIADRQQSLLMSQIGTVKSSWLISDFQKNMAPAGVIKTDTGININLIQVIATPLPNVAVDSVGLLNAVHRPGDSEKLVIRLHNYADQRAEKIPLKLFINGSQKALGSFSINARSIQEDTLSFSGLQAGWQRALLQLEDNPVTFDNQFYFTFGVEQQMNVLLINNGKADPYLTAVFGADHFFNVKKASAGNIDYASISSYPVVVVSNLNEFSTGLSQQLKFYVDRGGTLAVFPAPDADLTNYRIFLSAVGAGYPTQLVTGDTKVAGLNLQNPVFKNVFESYPQNPDLPSVKKYYKLSTLSASLKENLMTLQNGDPLWVDYGLKKGKVYLSAVPLDESFSNLPRHALFVPMVFRIALLSGYDRSLFYTLGKTESIAIAPVPITGNQLLKLNRNKLTIIPDLRQQDGDYRIFIADQLHQPGIYELKKQDSLVAPLAFNDDRKESDMSYLTDAQLKKLLPVATTIARTPNGPLNTTLAPSNLGTQLWKLCIILTLIFLAAEILLIRYYHPGKQGFSNN